MTIAATPPPPKDLRQFLNPAKIWPNRTYRFLILSHRIYGWDFHWADKQIAPCLISSGQCSHCSAAHRSRWMGFVAVLGYRSKQPVLLPITHTAYDWCADLQLQDGNLRGMAIAVSRMGDKKNSPLKIEVFHPAPHERLPSDAPNPNVPLAVGRLYRFDATGFPDETHNEETPCPQTNRKTAAEVVSSVASGAEATCNSKPQANGTSKPPVSHPFAPRAWQKGS